MSQLYRAKDGTVHTFPDDATPEEIQAAADEIDQLHPVMKTPPPVRSDRELFAFDSPYAREGKVSGLQMLLAAGKSAFGSDEEAARYLAEKGGGSATTDPRTGAPIVVSPTGQRFFLNDPGFNQSDVTDFAGNVAAFLPAGRVAQGVTGVGGRMMAGAGATAATDAGLQLGFTGRVDPGRAASAATFGAGGEAIAPFFGAVFRAARTGSMSRQELILRGRAEIQRQKVAGKLDDDAAMRLGQELDQIQAGGDPRAMLSEAEFGFRYTQGQKTGNHRQLTREEMLRNTTGSRAGAILGDNAQFNYDRAIGAIDDLQQGITGRGGRVNVVDAVDRAGNVVRREAQALDSQVDDAYARFRETKAYAGTDPQRTLPGRVEGALRDFDVAPPTTPAAARAVTLVRETFADPRQAMSATRLDQFRRRLRTLQGTASNPTDRAATQKVIREFDSWLDDTAAAGLIGGDQQAVAVLKEARKLRSEYGARFGDTGEFATRFDKIVKGMVEDGADPEQLAKAIYGSSQVSQQWANRALLRVDIALGKNPQARADLRAAVLTKLAQGRNGESVSVGQLQNNLRTLLVDNPALARNVLGRDGMDKVGRLISALTPLLKTADKRSSGTTERMWRYITASVTGLPVLGRMLEVLKSAGDVPAATRAVSPLPPLRPNLIPALGAAYGDERGR